MPGEFVIYSMRTERKNFGSRGVSGVECLFISGKNPKDAQMEISTVKLTGFTSIKGTLNVPLNGFLGIMVLYTIIFLFISKKQFNF